ncbi:MAG TPA: carbohydrate ABC transporter permease [Thermotogota bacterium]|nr:carbohydrate ABC transporter permease [Thermotogota bacterium]HPJ89940.1 carbohydrate ABC transporter permease [Thermotogota bacterium]HPR96639.1 carbohydrate ABC transporter permease [Thermotogota bacterium]
MKIRREKTYRKIIRHAFLMLGAFLSVLPFMWLITTSLKPPNTLYSSPLLIPTHFYIENYREALQAAPFGRFALNSLIMAAGIVFCQTIFSSFAGYAFARFKFRFKNALFFVFLATMMISSYATIIPNFLTINALGWYDTFAALIIPRAASVFSVFLFRQFFLTLPKEIEDAASIDGCGKLKIFFRIALPLSKPVFVTSALFSFLFAWNDFMWPLIVTDSETMRTIQLGLSVFQGRYGVRWTLLAAATVLSMLPTLIAFLLAQKQFIKGIANSGLKG